jgi:hypothetical protein
MVEVARVRFAAWNVGASEPRASKLLLTIGGLSGQLVLERFE